MTTLSELITARDTPPQENLQSFQGIPSISSKSFDNNPSAEKMPRLKHLMTCGDDENSPSQIRTSSSNQFINDLLSEGPLPQTRLGESVNNLLNAWVYLLVNINAQTGFTPPSMEHIKETAECAIRQLKDSCEDLNGVFTRVAMEWRLSRQSESVLDDLEDIDRSIMRQETLIARANGILQRRGAEMADYTDIASSTEGAMPVLAIEMVDGRAVLERCKDKRLMKPIVYGNTAVSLGFKRPEDGHTHEWTVFLRPYYAEDMSRYIRKVQFKLHDSYLNPTRVIERSPFELTETGWGEFEIQIKIYFVDVNEKPITAFHYLRLFQPQLTLPNGKTIVASEYYDEIVFQEPTVYMYKALMSSESKKVDQKRFHTDFSSLRKRTQESLLNARKEIGREIDDFRDSLRASHALIEKYRKEVESLEATTASGSDSFHSTLANN